MPQKSFKRSSIRDSKKPSAVYKNAASSSGKFRSKDESLSNRDSGSDSSSCSVGRNGYRHPHCSSLATSVVFVYGVVAVTALLVEADKIVVERLFSVPVLGIMGVLFILQAFAFGKRAKEMKHSR